MRTEVLFCSVQIEDSRSKSTFSNDYLDRLNTELQKFEKIIVVFGQMRESIQVGQHTRKSFPILSDVISNYKEHDAIRYHELMLNNLDSRKAETLRPKLLITIAYSLGNSSIEKKLSAVS